MTYGPIFGDRKTVPILGPRKRALGGPKKAIATIQWDKFLATANIGERIPLRINMDETSVKIWPGARPGCVAMPHSTAAGAAEVEQRVPLRAQRTAVSVVAFITDDEEAQRLLPQFIVVNKRTLTVTQARAWHTAAHAPVVLLRRDSAWLNAPALMTILRKVGHALGSLVDTRRVILSMDACPVHLHSRVLQTVAACGMHILPIAAQATKFLQPLDVGAFLPFKERYRALYAREQLLAHRGELPADTALRLLADAARQVLVSGTWRQTFRRCGFGSRRPTSARFRRALGPEPMPLLIAKLPSLADLQSLLPRRREVDVSDLFPLFLHPEGLPEHPRADRAYRRRPPPPLALSRSAADAAGLPQPPRSDRAAPSPARLAPPAFARRVPRAIPLWPWRRRPAPPRP